VLFSFNVANFVIPRAARAFTKAAARLDLVAADLERVTIRCVEARLFEGIPRFANCIGILYILFIFYLYIDFHLFSL
jgi:hypothetical protein